MEAKATLRNLRMSPRKVGRVAFPLRGLTVERADGHLSVLPHAAAHPIRKLLLSAVANALALGARDKETLVIKEVVVNQGATLKRYRPRSRGMANPIAKRVSHITLVLEGGAGKVRKAAAAKGAQPERAARQEASETQSQAAGKIPPRSIPKTSEILKKGIKPAGTLKDFGRKIFRRKVI